MTDGRDAGIDCTLSVPVSGSGFAAAAIAEDGAVKSTGSSISGSVLSCKASSGVMTAVSMFPFKDVPTNAWYFGDAYYAYNNALFAGTSETAFSPDTKMTRAMLVTVLWRLEGSPRSAEPAFDDVRGTWCSKAVGWAAANGIVNGYSESVFALAR